jgi:hypothetical protein
MSKTIDARTQQKYDTTANWNKATNFIPMVGEIIVYTDGWGTNQPRIKIGNGTTTVINLPFTDEEITEAEIDEICNIFLADFDKEAF